MNTQEMVDDHAAEQVLASIIAPLRAGKIVPFIGPGLIELAHPAVPTTPEALAAFFGTRVALPRRAKGNAWAAAQHIESMKHRSTVTKLMNEAFGPAVAPTALHHYLASLGLPMIVDTWYDGAMRAALASRSDWGEIQGNTRAGIGEDRWYRFYDSLGGEADRVERGLGDADGAGRELWTPEQQPHGAGRQQQGESQGQPRREPERHQPRN